MNTKELVNDTVKRSLAKYHEAFTNSLKQQLSELEQRVEKVEDSALDINALEETEITNLMK